jgi:hypothetical protein
LEAPLEEVRFGQDRKTRRASLFVLPGQSGRIKVSIDRSLGGARPLDFRDQTHPGRRIGKGKVERAVIASRRRRFPERGFVDLATIGLDPLEPFLDDLRQDIHGTGDLSF